MKFSFGSGQLSRSSTSLQIRVWCALALTLLSLGTGRAQTSDGRWIQSDLNPPKFGAMTKQFCMAKSIASMKHGCASQACYETLAGITGDCLTLSKGDMESFCQGYDKDYLVTYCDSQILDAKMCNVLRVTQRVMCRKPASAPSAVAP